MFDRDPLRNPEELVRRVYAYAAYRLGDGPDAEDVTSEVFERALRYRSSFDPAKGRAISWLIGIAMRCADDASAARREELVTVPERGDGRDLEADALRRVALARPLRQLGLRDRELIALRFGADLTAKQIGQALGLTTNAAEVALHRALDRLRALMEREPEGAAPEAGLKSLQPV